ncbi:MAG: hypothetical protein BroJett015_14020 [Chloroflexota bacterium]|nr:hypothetical protein [Ardenticatenaceae bacterium]GIK55739.1 MAG: hypothetical protein BroJett015_14020 [Chloroflexota bacterium]
MPPYTRRWLVCTAVILLAVVAAAPVFAGPGLLNTRGGGDSPFLLQRLQQLETAVLDGHFPARWMPDANYGYGYPFYNYYAPLSIYITLFFRLIGFGYIPAIQLSQAAGFIVAAVGMFALGRRWFQSEWAGLLTAVAYTFAPFHMVNVYVRGDSLAEFWAMAFYPLVLLAADALVAGGKGQVASEKAAAVCYLPLAIFSLAYAALILSHNISALIFSPFLLLYLFLRWLHLRPGPKPEAGLLLTDHRLRITAYGLPLTAAFLLAFALSAWFFVPALAEKGLAQLGPVTQGYFHFSNHFLGTTGQPLWQNSFFFDYGVDGRAAFRMGLIQIISILTGIILLLISASPRLSAFTRVPISPDRRRFILLALLVSTVMLLPLSRPLWEHVPLLSFTQFPWRFLSVQAFAGALAVGALAFLPGRKVVGPVTAVLLILAALGNLHPDYLPLTDADVTAERLAQYEWFSGNVGTTISAEYLPATVQPRMATSGWLNAGERWPVRALSGDLLAATLQAAKTGRQTWQVETAVPTILVFPTLHWPGWQGWVDGEEVGVRPSPGSGLIMLDVPAGVHTVELRLARTPVRLVAELISLAALLLAIWLVAPSILRIANKWRVGRWALLAGLGLLLLIWGGRLWPQPELANGDLNWDFAQMAYLHHAPEGVRYANGAVLQNYEYSAEVMGAGDSLTIHTHWDNADSIPLTMRLVTPAANRVSDPSPPVIVAQTQLIQNGQATFNLLIPPDAPPGLVVPQLVLPDGRALTPSGGKRGDLFLRPLRLINSVPAAQHVPALDVRAMAVQSREPGVLDIQLGWRTAVLLTQNYNMALRLTDARGRFLQLADRQPGYGFLPSSLWPAGEWVHDWQALTLPPGDHEFPYVLVAQLYDVSAPHQPVLTRRLGELWSGGDGEWRFQPNEPLFVLPEEMMAATAVFNDQIALQGYTLHQTTTVLEVALVWQALAPGQTEYTRFVHLIPAGSSQPPLAQDDNLPRFGTYPTSQWTAGEVVVDGVSLDLTAVPSGEYQLAVGFYERLADGSLGRATAVDENGAPLADDRFVLPELIRLRE